MILMKMVNNSQSSQNSKFAISLQCKFSFKKEVEDEVDFLHVDKHQSFLKKHFEHQSFLQS